MRANQAPKWLGRMILCDELRGLGLPWCPEAVAFRPADQWLTFPDTLQAVAVSSRLVERMRRRIPVGAELRDAAWRCTVAALARLPREAWPANRQRAAELGNTPSADIADQAEQRAGRRSVPISITWRKSRHG